MIERNNSSFYTAPYSINKLVEAAKPIRGEPVEAAAERAGVRTAITNAERWRLAAVMGFTAAASVEVHNTGMTAHVLTGIAAAAGVASTCFATGNYLFARLDLAQLENTNQIPNSSAPDTIEGLE